MILCVRGTSRSSEQSTRITQREQVFFLTVLLDADWLSRQTPITWKGMKNSVISGLIISVVNLRISARFLEK